MKNYKLGKYDFIYKDMNPLQYFLMNQIFESCGVTSEYLTEKYVLSKGDLQQFFADMIVKIMEGGKFNLVLGVMLIRIPFYAKLPGIGQIIQENFLRFSAKEAEKNTIYFSKLSAEELQPIFEEIAEVKGGRTDSKTGFDFSGLNFN